MKNLKKFLAASLLLVVGVLIAYACSKDEVNRQTIESADEMRESDPKSLYFKISEGLYELAFVSKMDETNIVSSQLTVFHNKTKLFTTNYGFNTESEHWKLLQAPVVIEKAMGLKSEDIPQSVLADVSTILTDNVGYVFYKTLESKNRFVVSAINYHKSIINSVLRAYETNADCGCTVHPEFLLDKSFFNCQEEHFYKTALLKEIVYDYAAENPIDLSTENLMAFLNTYEGETIRFDDYYNFYVSKQDFNLFVYNTLKANSRDCAWWCPIGCGTSHGCCGNYSGCCLYRDITCYIHDKICTNCKPAWFCLPGCKPDKPSTSLISIE